MKWKMIFHLPLFLHIVWCQAAYLSCDRQRILSIDSTLIQYDWQHSDIKIQGDNGCHFFCSIIHYQGSRHLKIFHWYTLILHAQYQYGVIGRRSLLLRHGCVPVDTSDRKACCDGFIVESHHTLLVCLSLIHVPSRFANSLFKTASLTTRNIFIKSNMNHV